MKLRRCVVRLCGVVFFALGSVGVMSAESDVWMSGESQPAEFGDDSAVMAPSGLGSYQTDFSTLYDEFETCS